MQICQKWVRFRFNVLSWAVFDKKNRKFQYLDGVCDSDDMISRAVQKLKMLLLFLLVRTVKVLDSFGLLDHHRNYSGVSMSIQDMLLLLLFTFEGFKSHQPQPCQARTHARYCAALERQ